MTTKTPKDRVLGWRSEIADELVAAQKEMPPLVAAHETATAAASDLADDYRETQKLLGQIVNPEGPIRLRSDYHWHELEQAKSRAARALADIQAVRIRIENLQRALAQIDRVMPPADEEVA